MPRPLSSGRSEGVFVRVGFLAIVAAVAVAAYAAYRIWDQAGRDERRAADVIVVMGAAQYDGRPSPLFAARLDHAIELFHDGVAPRLIVTGGKREGDRTTEAASAREYALRHDVPEAAILVEDRSRTTLQSVRGVGTLMRGEDLKSAVFVSDPTHMLRVLRMAADVGIDAYGSPTRTSPLEGDPAGRIDATVHELGALGVYFLTGESP
ncbi:MAG TPA: YdcF family protein [Candidatus Limnocylindria bacterium]|nr:YdcF family protein [Candidatus Limnocylindria bacterium]